MSLNGSAEEVASRLHRIGAYRLSVPGFSGIDATAVCRRVHLFRQTSGPPFRESERHRGPALWEAFRKPLSQRACLPRPERCVASRPRRRRISRRDRPSRVDSALRHQPHCLLAASRQSLAPEPQSTSVVLAPALNVVDLELTRLQHLDGVADVVQFAAGEDVFLDEAVLRPPFVELLPRRLCPACDRVIEEDPAVAQQHAFILRKYVG